MKQSITLEQVQELSAEEQLALYSWWLSTIEHDDDVAHVYIVEEDREYIGEWDREYSFDYPEEYMGKLKNHRGTILPLLSIAELIAFLDRYDHAYLAFRIHLLLHFIDPEWQFDTNALLETLWQGAKTVLQQQAGDIQKEIIGGAVDDVARTMHFLFRISLDERG